MSETSQDRARSSKSVTLAAIRKALGDYVASEGCGCCRDEAAHTKAAESLGKLLRVRKYSDGSGYDFYRYATKRRKR